MRTIKVLAIMLGLAVSGTAAEPKPVKLEDVPLPVKIAAAVAATSVTDFKSAMILRGSKDTPIYQVNGTTKGGVRVVVSAREDGTVLGVIVQVSFNDVPFAARRAIAEEFPKFKPSAVGAFGKTDQDVAGFRFEGDDAEGKRQVLFASRNGAKYLVISIVNDAKPSERGNPPPAKDEKPIEQQESLQGTWRVVGGRQDSQELTEDNGKNGRLIIDKDGCKLLGKDKHHVFGGKLSLNPKTDPKQFDVEDVALLGIRGIYTFENGHLLLCFTGKLLTDRPKKFGDAGLETAEKDEVKLPSVYDEVKPGKADDNKWPTYIFLRLERIQDGK